MFWSMSDRSSTVAFAKQTAISDFNACPNILALVLRFVLRFVQFLCIYLIFLSDEFQRVFEVSRLAHIFSALLLMNINACSIPI